MSVSPGRVLVASCLSRRLSKLSQRFWLRLLSNYGLYSALRTCEILCTPFKRRVFVSYIPLALPYMSPAGFQSLDVQGAHLLDIRPPSWRNGCGPRPLTLGVQVLGRTWVIVIILAFVGCLLRIWVLHLHLFYPAHCGSFFIFLVVENLLCWFSGHPHR